MTSRAERSRKGQRGQAMIEFLLITPVLFMLTIGLIDAGRAFYHYNELSHAAREAARYAAVWGGGGHSPGGLVGGTAFDWTADGNVPGTYSTTVAYRSTPTIVGTATRSAMGADPSVLGVTITTLSRAPGTPVTVTLVYSFQPGSSLLVGGRVIPIAASSSMIIE